jgi:FkbH-like protein
LNYLNLKYPFDSESILKKRKSLKRELLAGSGDFMEKKIAVLGGSTTSDILCCLELFLLDYGIKPTFYESHYAQYWQDAMFSAELAEFKPDIVFVHTTSRNIIELPMPGDSAGAIDTMLDRQLQHFAEMWDMLRERLNCPVIQNNFERPLIRLLGNKDVSAVCGRANYLSRLNQKFYEYAQTHENFYINDIDYLAASYGLEKWADPFYWHMYKYACCVSAIPELAFSVANIIKSLCGMNKKALVLDLDNTLWGGIVGDDGVDGLALGPETPHGQVYTEFQDYVKALGARGIVLSVCSKNDGQNALAGLRHPYSRLSPDDFAVIKANWDSKDDNILVIAQELDLGADSFVFVDDNPAERELVQCGIDGIAVPDIGENPEHYIYRIDRAGFFETTDISHDDLKRGEMYRENAVRRQFRQSFESHEDYLTSLEMRAKICAFESAHMQRVAQLTNKSNQFNLTAKRYTESEIQEVAASSRHISLCGRLADKFGDNGIVSVVIGREDINTLHVELWIMSCRVLKRDMEYAMLDKLAEECVMRGVNKIVGYYYPTAKNSMVREFYGSLGFTKISEDDSGASIWEYNVGKHNRRNHVIRIV